MTSMLIDLGNAYDDCRIAWHAAMTDGEPFSIADALGPETTVAILTSKLASHVPILGAIAGVVEALEGKPADIQEHVIREEIEFSTPDGLATSARHIGAASRWVALALKATLEGNSDPIGEISQDVVDEVLATGASGDAAKMSGYLAAVTRVGALANFPDTEPAHVRAVAEMEALSTTASTGAPVTAPVVNLIIEKGAAVSISGVHGNGNVITNGTGNSVHVGAAGGTVRVNEGQPTQARRWEASAQLRWVIGTVIALAGLCAAWLQLGQS